MPSKRITIECIFLPFRLLESSNVFCYLIIMPGENFVVDFRGTVLFVTIPDTRNTGPHDQCIVTLYPHYLVLTLSFTVLGFLSAL